MTLPVGVRQVHDFWKEQLKLGGFKFRARIINYQAANRADVGLFFSWPKSPLDET